MLLLDQEDFAVFSNPSKIRRGFQGRAYEQALSEWDDIAVQRTMNKMSSIAAELHARGYDLPSIMRILQHSDTETYLKSAS